MPKYLSDKNGIIEDDLYFEVFEKKGIKQIRMRRTQDFGKLKGLEISVADEIPWTYGNSLFKLSYKYYGSYDYWWCIALVNNKPTDAHFSIGDLVLIPSNPGLMAEALR